MHGLRRERSTVEAAGPEPDHFLLPIDDLEGEIRTHLHHDHVDGIGADVDGGHAHGAVLTIMKSAACPHHHAPRSYAI